MSEDTYKPGIMKYINHLILKIRLNQSITYSKWVITSIENNYMKSYFEMLQSWMVSFIHSFSIYLLSANYVPDARIQK